MEFRFNVNEIFKHPIVEINSTLIPPGVNLADKRALWDAVGKVSDVVNTMGEASAAAQGLTKAITTSERLRNSEHRLYLLIDQGANNAKGVVTGMLKTGKKGLYVFDRDGHHFQVQPSCVLDFYIHESKQRMGLGKKLFEHMLEKEKVEPVKMAIDRPSDKFLGFLNKHYSLENPVKQMNNFVVYDGFFPEPAKKNDVSENNNTPLGKSNQPANGLQANYVSPYGRYGAPRPPCSMGQIIHNQSPLAQQTQEQTGLCIREPTKTRSAYIGKQPANSGNQQTSQSMPNIQPQYQYGSNQNAYLQPNQQQYQNQAQEYQNQSQEYQHQPQEYQNQPQAYQNQPQAYQNQPQAYQNPPQEYQNQPQAYQNQQQAYQNQQQAYQNQPQAYQNKVQEYQNQPQEYQNQPQEHQNQSQAYQNQPQAYQNPPQEYQNQPQEYQNQQQYNMYGHSMTENQNPQTDMPQQYYQNQHTSQQNYQQQPVQQNQFDSSVGQNPQMQQNQMNEHVQQQNQYSSNAMINDSILPQSQRYTADSAQNIEIMQQPIRGSGLQPQRQKSVQFAPQEPVSHRAQSANYQPTHAQSAYEQINVHPMQENQSKSVPHVSYQQPLEAANQANVQAVEDLNQMHAQHTTNMPDNYQEQTIQPTSSQHQNIQNSNIAPTQYSAQPTVQNAQQQMYQNSQTYQPPHQRTTYQVAYQPQQFNPTQQQYPVTPRQQQYHNIPRSGMSTEKLQPIQNDTHLQSNQTINTHHQRNNEMPHQNLQAAQMPQNQHVIDTNENIVNTQSNTYYRAATPVGDTQSYRAADNVQIPSNYQNVQMNQQAPPVQNYQQTLKPRTSNIRIPSRIPFSQQNILTPQQAYPQAHPQPDPSTALPPVEQVNNVNNNHSNVGRMQSTVRVKQMPGYDATMPPNASGDMQPIGE